MTGAGIHAAALLALNVLDAALSSWLFRLGLATEANPVMAAAWRAGPGTFVALKLALVTLMVGALWLTRRPLADTGLRVLCAAYAAVVVLEVGMLLTAV